MATLYIVLGLAHYAHAGDPVTLNITGNVVASPCEISAASQNITIDLGEGQDLQTADLNTAGSSSPWRPVSVSLENCPPGTSSVTATFHGTPDAADAETLYSNTGTATNVAVQLEGTSGESYGNGKTSTINIADATDGKPTWDLQTRAFSKTGNVTPGTISSVITMDFTYN
ncbi:type 1 fimbrial protein [Salmonella enterica]|nr:type 1 fimbrial protein [Salmonella enterica]ECB7890601.1 type 1 fimbrial protein [Salmonella enterica subsp. enterica serovar Bareilly]ECN9266473.1 type 1 fimbrial protein [Salmonella enterica subsp. enterica serovar Typhimurium]EHG4385625.1 type 1 fimbrial protein [Salmonella enterica subsp. enterica serovar Typhimurium]